MSEKLSWTANAQAIGGPKLSVLGTSDVDAYDKMKVNIAAAAADAEVELQPGASGQVQFLMITSSSYDDALTYKVNDTTADAVKLNGPHMLIGSGAVSLLDEAPAKLFISNGTGADATIEILIGRDATPEA